MKTLSRLLVCSAIFASALVAPTMVATDAMAQATCRARCTDEEQACLKRTSNKSQCGGKAQACMAKCK